MARVAEGLRQQALQACEVAAGRPPFVEPDRVRAHRRFVRGADGKSAVAILKDEMLVTMRQIGRPTIDALTRDAILDAGIH